MKTVIKNIGTIISGDIENPVVDGDAILVEDNKIAKVGSEVEMDLDLADKVVDVGGMTVTPGLIDSHVHPVIGDYTPRQDTLNFIESSKHGGVTTMISAGEVHTPGRPKDPSGVKALAKLAHKASENSRPGGVKLHGGALILEKGLTEEDFQELADEGVWLVGEIGLGSVAAPEDASPMVKWAKKAGMKVHMHTGGTSIPGSSTVTADHVMEVQPTVSSHINGGPTAIPYKEVEKLVTESDIPLEIVHCGNPKMINDTIQLVKEHNCMDRIIIGNDSPSGTGIIPLGILRVLAHIASLNDVAGEKAIAMATGNTASTFDLPVGLIKEGLDADLAVMDAPSGSAGEYAAEALERGDLPGVAMVMIDGKVEFEGSRNTPPAKGELKIN
ncbi:MAG: amidohydrolase family protein [Bacillota bacterium]